ncbi:MAG: FAD:protein FMN transferase [Thermodesulfovibrionales bacterium]
MDTIVTITVVNDSKVAADRAIEHAFNELKRLEKSFNFYSEESELSMINRNAGLRPVKVSEDMMDILKKAIYVSELSGGAFDITTGPLTRLWDFHKKNLPDRGRLKEALKLVGYKNIIINEKDSTVFFKKKGMLIDLGGIAKGYGADRAIEILKAEGMKAALVAIAGDIRAYGVKNNGNPWMIGIKHPRAKGDDDLIATLPLKDAAISTSGDYERFFIKNGKRYHHILNPLTGYPADSTGGVSVIGDAGYLTDSIATAVFLLGPEKGIDLLRKLGLKGVFITEDGKRFLTGDIDGIRFK